MAREHNFIAGQMVEIISTTYSDRRFGINDRMLSMVGKTAIIEDTDSQSVCLRECYWHPKDLKALPVRPRAEMKHMKDSMFDETLLDVGKNA